MKPPAPQLWNHWPIDAVGLGACLLLAALLYVLGVGPLWRQQATRDARQAQWQTQNQRAQQVTANLAALQQQLEATRDAVRRSALQLQPASAINQRLARLTELAGGCGLSVLQLRPEPPRRQARCEAVPIRLTGTGAFPAAALFLHRVHEAFPDTGIASFELSGQPGQPAAPAAFRFDLVWHAAPATVTTALAP